MPYRDCPNNDVPFEKFACGASMADCETDCGFVLSGSISNDKINETVQCSVLNDHGSIIESDLSRATEEILDNNYNKYANLDSGKIDNNSTEVNRNLVKFALNNAERDVDGRIRMPLLWNTKVSHLTGNNYNLSKAILRSNLKKFKKDKNKLILIDDTFKEQENMNIIEKIDNFEDFESIRIFLFCRICLYSK